MVDDFLIQEADRVINVNNAPSPAATASLNIGKTIVERLVPAARLIRIAIWDAEIWNSGLTDASSPEETRPTRSSSSASSPTRVFRHFGVPEADARQAADVLATSDLRGIDSHGVARLHTYFDMLTLGRINPRPEVRIVRESPSTATVDGDNGLGLVVGPRANAIAMDKAEAVGSGWVSVCNTNHFGIAGYYPLQALKRDLIGWAMTNATKLVAPLWAAERMLGTNPIAIAFPGKEEPPIVIDMATSAVAYGKIEIAMRKGSRSQTAGPSTPPARSPTTRAA